VSHPQQRQGVLVAIIAYGVWGLLTLYWRQLRDFDAAELIAWRIVLAALVMALVMSAAGRWRRLAPLRHDRRLAGRMLLAALLLTVNWSSYVAAVVTDNVLATALGYFMAPLGSMAIGVWVLGEHLRTLQWAAAALGAAAVVVITVSYGELPMISLLIAASWTLYGYAKKGAPLHAVDGMAAETLALVVPAVIVAVVLSTGDGSVVNTASTGELWFLSLSGLVTVAPLTLFAYAAQRVPLSIIGLLQYSIPVINFVLGWAVFHEPLPAGRVAGFALVWCALVVLAVDGAVSRRTSSDRDPQGSRSEPGCAREPGAAG
jgi:chloramphenicol-sensitive protein RarD